VPEPQLRRLDGDGELADGVRIIATPGHTPGHQSVVIEGGSDVAVIAAQCVWTLGEFQAAAPADEDMHEGLASLGRESVARLLRLDPAIAYFSHDPSTYVRP
jgi:glyoxylase-like metal-dependent hydrolase (beta-lactamase superfamily II)